MNLGFHGIIKIDLSFSKTNTPDVPDEEDIMLSATVTLTDEQIKALPTTLATIVSAPGAAKLLLPWRILVTSTIVSAYTNISANAQFWARYNDGSSSANIGYDLENDGPDTFVSDILTGAEMGVAFGEIFDTAAGYTQPYYNIPASAENSRLELGIANAAGNFTGGNAGNALKVTAFYTVADI